MSKNLKKLSTYDIECIVNLLVILTKTGNKGASQELEKILKDPYQIINSIEKGFYSQSTQDRSRFASINGILRSFLY